jgi:hypothetical protein
VSAKALKASQAKVRAITGRTRGRTLRQLMLGGRAFFGVAEVRSPRRDLDNWLRRRRSYHGKPGGRQLAWHTVKAAHGPWRLRQSPALAIALPQRSVAALGLPSRTEV